MNSTPTPTNFARPGRTETHRRGICTQQTTEKVTKNYFVPGRDFLRRS